MTDILTNQKPKEAKSENRQKQMFLSESDCETLKSGS
jgi:hypothetical protein